jgi:hypothetical protein
MRYDIKSMTTARALYEKYEASQSRELDQAARAADVLARYTDRYFVYALGQ